MIKKWGSGDKTGKRHEVVRLGGSNAWYLDKHLSKTAVWIYQNSLNDTFSISKCRFYNKRKGEEGVVNFWILVNDVHTEVFRWSVLISVTFLKCVKESNWRMGRWTDRWWGTYTKMLIVKFRCDYKDIHLRILSTLLYIWSFLSYLQIKSMLKSTEKILDIISNKISMKFNTLNEQ